MDLFEFEKFENKREELLNDFLIDFRATSKEIETNLFSERIINEVQKFYLNRLEMQVDNDHLDWMMMAYFSEACKYHLGGKLIYCDDPNHIQYQKMIMVDFKNYDGTSIAISRHIESIKSTLEKESMWETIKYALNRENFENDLREQMRNLRSRKK